MRRLVRGRDGRAVEGAISIPVDSVNECALLTAALVDESARNSLADRVSADLFSADNHSTIWAAIVEMRRQGLDYSPEVIRRITGREDLAAYCNRLVEDRRAPPANLRHHVNLLYWDRGRIEAARGPLPSLLKALKDPSTRPADVQKLAEELAGCLKQSGGYRRYIRDPDHVAKEAKALHGIRVPYGIEGFDDYEDGSPRVVLGAAPGKVTIVTALSGAGKSQFCRALALAQANMGRRVAYGAWEMGSSTMLGLMACSTIGLNRTAFVAGTLSSDDVKAHAAEVDRLKTLIRFFDLPVGKVRGQRRTNDEVLDDIHGMLLDFGCEFVIFDLWHLAFSFRFESEENEALTRQQAIAQETNVHCVLAHQQRLKDVEQSADPKPGRATTKGSSRWVDCADTMIGVNLPHLWKPVPPTVIELPLLKQRYGRWPLGVEADYDEHTGNFWGCRSVEYRRTTMASKIDGWIDGGDTKGRGRRKSRETD